LDAVLISIIIPVYNVEAYITDCLSSIKKQSGDFEVIIVDDGSKDNSINEAKILIGDDSRFRIVSKVNGGLSSARNYGIVEAQGKYLSFIDSDDIVSEEYIRTLEKRIKASNSDMYIFDYCRGKNTHEIQGALVNSVAKKKKLKDFAGNNFSWMRVVKKEFFNSIKFPEGYLYEDVYMTTILNTKVKSIEVIPKCLYGYRKRDNSITTSSAIKQFSILDTLEKLRNDLCSNNGDVAYKKCIINISKSILINLLRLRKIDKKNVIFNLGETYSILRFCDIQKTEVSNFNFLIAMLFKFPKINSFAIDFFNPIFKLVDKDWKGNE